MILYVIEFTYGISVKRFAIGIDEFCSLPGVDAFRGLCKKVEIHVGSEGIPQGSVRPLPKYRPDYVGTGPEGSPRGPGDINILC